MAALLPVLAGARPAYRYLAQEISALILDGRIALHVRLPAERELATALHTSRMTVTAAYDLLRESGYAHSRQGAGTWTALPDGAALTGVRRVLPPADEAIDLARASPGLPEDVLAEAVGRVAPALAGYAPTPGYLPYGLPQLRAAIAERFTRRGLATVPEQILVTSGAQHAWTLVLGLLGSPGDRVVVESPSYPNALDAVRRARLRAVSIPVTERGWDVDVVVSSLREVVPQVAYLIPDFHNPTGLLMPDGDRERIGSAAARSGTWLVVDETLAELALDVPSPVPFAVHAPGSSQIITIGSMSKTFWGGLRIGWLRAPSRLVTELAAQRIATDLGGSVLDQLLAVELLGRVDEVLPARLEQLRTQRDTLVAALSESFPRWRWQLPAGGLSLWVDLGAPVAADLAERARQVAVRIEGGGYFAANPGVFEQRLRVPYTVPAPVLREAVRRLALAWNADLPLTSTPRPRWVV